MLKTCQANKRSAPVSAAPVVHIHLAEPSNKRRRVLSPSNAIDLTSDEEVSVKVKVEQSGDKENLF